MKTSPSPVPVVIGTVSLLLYFAALFTVAFTGVQVTYMGFECLLLGGLTLLSLAYYPVWFVAWFANLLYLPALISVFRGRTSAGAPGLAAGGFVFGLTSLHVRSVLPDSSRMDVPVSAGPGLYLWIGSLALGLAAQVIIYLKAKKS